MISKLFFFALLLISCLNAEDLELKRLFEKFDINGTLVISSLKNEDSFVYNPQRAKQRFCTASTFKIPHTLIALNEKLISNENDIIQWDGIQRAYGVWNKDQTLHSAMSVSCVWCYQKFSTHISKEKYLSYLKALDYGSKTIGEDKSRFWLDGSLSISANEQISFLKKFYNYNLPIDKKYIDITKKILSVEKNAAFSLNAKSGWDGAIGWYVGYLTTKKDVYFFAMNGEISETQLSLRKEVVLEAFKRKQIIK